MFSFAMTFPAAASISPADSGPWITYRRPVRTPGTGRPMSRIAFSRESATGSITPGFSMTSSE